MKQTRVTTLVETTVSMQWRIQERCRVGPASLSFRQNWGPKDQKIFFGDPPFSKTGLDERPPSPLSHGLDPALHCYLDYEQSLFFLIVRREKRARRSRARALPSNTCEDRERLLAECNCCPMLLSVHTLKWRLLIVRFMFCVAKINNLGKNNNSHH